MYTQWLIAGAPEMAKCVADTLPEPVVLLCDCDHPVRDEDVCGACGGDWFPAADAADRLAAAEAVCEAIDGRHPIALGDHVGALLAAWRATKGTP